MINVLIVDDEKIEREGLKYLISTETKEHKIFEASNGREALQILREEDIQLLLTDIKMPHMTGLDFPKKAKEEQRDLQIIIFSGFSDFAFAAGSNTLWCHGIYPETGKSRGFSPSDPACGGDNCQSDKEGKS